MRNAVCAPQDFPLTEGQVFSGAERLFALLAEQYII